MLSRFLALLILLLPAGSLRAGLAAGELLLVVNKNVPEGAELARHYAAQRGVPANRLLELDLPAGEEISPDDYETLLADPVRAFLQEKANRPRCIVTFYGVPIRVAPRTRTAEVDAELRVIGDHIRQIEPRLSAVAAEAERLARLADKSFAAMRGNDLEQLMMRIRHAALATAGSLQKVEDEKQRQEIDDQWQRLSVAMEGKVALDEPPSTSPATGPAGESSGYGFGSAAVRRAARAKVREQGLARYAQLLEAQVDYLSAAQADSAVDNELATALWPAYRRERWQGNPLNAAASRTPASLLTIMVMRLDGPSPQVVRRIIDDGIAAERGGVDGRIVLDSWNKPLKNSTGSVDGYGRYDETIRRLHSLVAGQSVLPVIFDQSDQLVAEKSQNQIAIYCGWYDPNRVSLPGDFSRGAVGFHIASYTAVSVRGLGGGLWTPELLNAGVCATLGPVSEPYLSAFPDADEFFALLLNGKLTLAECYWATTPMVSWKMLMIGDPLYRPFAARPVLSEEQLPEQLRNYIQKNAAP